MVSHQPKKPGLLGRLIVSIRRLAAFFLAVAVTLKRRLTGDHANEPFARTLVVSLLTTTRWALPDELHRRDLASTTGQTIGVFCTKHSLAHKSVGLATTPPSTLHFIGPTKSRVLYYLHGGGYVQPITYPGHLTLLRECAKVADAQIVVVEYTLAPELPYPGQLVQALAGLRELLKTFAPSKIIMGGDSAGGNLALAVLAHVATPSKHAPALKMDGKFRGLLLISPWVGMDYKADSYKRNNPYDFITREPQMLNVTAYWRPGMDDPYCNQLVGDKQFWSRAVERTESMLITAGTREIFYDDIIEISEKLGAGEGKEQKIRLVICEREVHTNCILDSSIKVNPPVGMRKAILDWLSEVK